MSSSARKRRNREQDVVARIALATGEDPLDVQAALAALVADGCDFDEMWELLPDAINSGSVVDYVAAALTEREGGVQA